MDINFILASISVFLVVIIMLVIILLVAKNYLSPSGNVKITINDKVLDVPQGESVMATLNDNGIYLPSACGGKASCGQCKVQILEGGGEILDSEKSHFTRKEIKEGWRLGCQCKVKSDMKLHVDESVMGVKEWECTVIGNRKRRNIHQGIQSGTATGRAHGLRTGLLRADTHPGIRNGL